MTCTGPVQKMDPLTNIQVILVEPVQKMVHVTDVQVIYWNVQKMDPRTDIQVILQHQKGSQKICF